jgi:2-polyprenyl-6-methoxyphenol hydroxylase-like FAD-dependent oxidoreductase
MSSVQQVPLLVVGAGIGGLATALAIASTGRDVCVIEQAPELGEIGAGIQLAPNALRVLDQLGILDDVYDRAVFPQQATMRDATSGQILTALPFDASFVSEFGYPYVVTHRADLHDPLVRACQESANIAIETGKSAVRIRGEDQTVYVETDDGSVYETHAVVGADGLHSVVRDHVLGPSDVRIWGDVAYRGTVDYDLIADRDGKDDMTWWVGAGMHLIQYPLRSKELFNNVAVFTCRGEDPAAPDWGNVNDLEMHFSGKHPAVQQGAMFVGRDRRWIMVDREPNSQWSKGPITLVGDAAHPMLQYLAQGACQALEDAIVLSRELNVAPDPATAFLAYESKRAPHAASVQKWARLTGSIVHADGVTSLLRDALLQQRAPSDFSYFSWLYRNSSCPA